MTLVLTIPQTWLYSETPCSLACEIEIRHVQNQIFIGRDWYVIYTRSWFRSCMGLRLRSRLGNFGKISRDFGKYSSRPGFSVYNLGKITEIWSRLIFFVYCSLNLNTVIVLLPRKQREKRTRSRISRSRRDLQWTEMDMSAPYFLIKWGMFFGPPCTSGQFVG